MNPIAVFYHCRLSGGQPQIHFDSAIAIMAEQMQALKDSGLSDSASEIYIGINGEDALAAAAVAPRGARVINHTNGRTELPTFSLMRQWIQSHSDWYVLYHHSKGVTQPQDSFHHHHRRVMQRAVVENWEQCVRDLDRGFDAVGVNWVDPVARPALPGRFFAGNFWWARASFLSTLPPIPNNAASWHDRFYAEQWIGSGSSRPMVLDYERPELSREWVMSRKVRPT